MDTAIELAVGAGLALFAALAGMFFMRRPWPNHLDALGFSLLPANYSASWARALTHLGSLPALIIGVVVLAAVGVARRDRVRAVACAAGPLLAVFVTQELAKPLVDRHLHVGGGASYPSGTVTAIAALATATVLVVPSVVRGLTVVVGALIVAATCAAVVVLRWHFPTDALGGVCTGTGAVLLVDGILHLSWSSRLLARARRARRSD